MMNLPMPPNPYNHNIIRTPFGFIDTDIKGHIIINQESKMYKIMIFDNFSFETSMYFRGENDKFPTFKTSWQRLQNNFEKCIGWLQKQEFIEWFMSTPYFEHFAYKSEFAPYPNIPEGQGYKFCFDFEAIAQHYEFHTNYLDITTKREIAEFFAYTHYVNGKLVPIEDFNNRQPCLYSSFGSKLEHPHNPDVRIVGFQVLPRPLRQKAMAINLENCSSDYKKEMHCEELPREKKRAFEIFDKFEGGKLLMPDDYAAGAANIIRTRYKNEKLINESAFEKYCKEFKQNPKDILKRLRNKGYSLTSEHLLNTTELKADMQKEIDEHIIPWINEFVSYSPIIHPKN
ncbi:FRG domain-containing protein [Spirochaetes bacterium]|uniref:FRG domain-containing protein n=1 Tax=Candidatus Scatousia excrementipullorum TaxID=2840936 RepID=A0A9D9GZ95_9BACT|nr:FRG domain-containing protein [Candidatus Scatousia excrementipullorum]